MHTVVGAELKHRHHPGHQTIFDSADQRWVWILPRLATKISEVRSQNLHCSTNVARLGKGFLVARARALHELGKQIDGHQVEVRLLLVHHIRVSLGGAQALKQLGGLGDQVEVQGVVVLGEHIILHGQVVTLAQHLQKSHGRSQSGHLLGPFRQDQLILLLQGTGVHSLELLGPADTAHVVDHILVVSIVHLPQPGVVHVNESVAKTPLNRCIVRLQ
mmetsp:Transcript_83830/g.191360  ORF Transcript_83830/g.191360 Transcript_83830/m.191360 type:complete len:217 (-) Transcript_83830:178-828(-)